MEVDQKKLQKLHYSTGRKLIPHLELVCTGRSLRPCAARTPLFYAH
jgi:hypothetical protein